MTIRKVIKDHLSERGPELALVESSSALNASDDPLVFWTLHDTKPCLVDLTDLATGRAEPKKKGLEKRWTGAYSGRPELIHELIPAIREKLLWATEKTCKGFEANLKIWWRMFDEIERPDAETGVMVASLHSVRGLSHLHHQVAVQRFSPSTFSAFRSVADTTCRALGLPPLAWVGPGERRSKRHLPTPGQSRQLFLHIKRGWLETLDRWSLIEAMLTGSLRASSEEQSSLLQNAKYFAQVCANLLPQGRTFPTVEDIVGHWSTATGTTKMTMLRSGLSALSMYEAHYPTATEIRMAFHLALIGGGWNVQTLLDLPVKAEAEGSERMPFLQDHPQDPNRYILIGYKERGKSDHTLHGDWKSDRSPGRIIRTLVERTWPLRQEVLRLLREARLHLDVLTKKRADNKTLAVARKNVVELQRKSTSVWLYVGRDRIEALSAETFDKILRNAPFLRVIIDQINAGKSDGTEDLPRITASDFRDIFAEYVYRTSGGSVLAVMRLLGHRSLSSTTRYLDNTVINQQSARTFTCYTNEMWAMCATTGRIDHTVLRQIVEEGHVTPVQLLQLDEYRKLKKSRLRIGCKEPTRPPSRLDPNFKIDGQALCATHRCMLCFENAVIAPEALEGLTMRLAELRHLQARIPVEHFVRGGDISFQAEMDNITAALLGFEGPTVQTMVDVWAGRIARGEHRAPEFHGIGRG